MRKLRSFLSRVLLLFRRSQIETEIDEEIRTHLEMQADDLLRDGMSPGQARQAALRNFGSVDLTKERYRDRFRFRTIETLLQDIRFALRMLRKSPGFTVVAVLIIALSIGINATVFTLTNAVLFKGFPYIARNDRFLYIKTGTDSSSFPDIQDWRAQAKSFDGMAIVNGAGRMTLGASPERYLASQLSANTFRLMGQKPIAGRDFLPSDEISGAAPVVILGYRIWQQRYGRDPAIVGQAIRINGSPATVIGVMGPGFSFPYNEELWVPVVATADLQQRGNRSLWLVIGRLAEGASVQNARAEMEIIGRRLAVAYPLTNTGALPVVQTYNEYWVGPRVTRIYGAVWGAVAFVWLIACANVANLMLSRATGRSREISLRIALGATRWRIIRQLLVESLLLSLSGGLFGGVIAKWGVSARIYGIAAFSAFPNGAPSWFDFAMDYRVLAYLIAISIGAGLLFGLAPVVRLRKLDVHSMLKDGGRGAIGGRRGNRLSSIMVIGEVALALVLLAGAGVMIRSVLGVYTADFGVNPANLLTASVSLPAVRYPDAETQIRFFERLKMRLEAIPGVDAVVLAASIPTEGVPTHVYELAGTASPGRTGEPRPTLSALTIGPDYFRTLGVPMRAGREFNEADGPSENSVVIVNQQFAAMAWPGEDPTGKRLRLFDGDTPKDWRTVIGVAANIVQNDRTRQRFDPLVYLPFQQAPVGSMNLIARTRVEPASLAAAFQREIQSIDPDLPFGRPPATLTERLEQEFNYRFDRTMGILFLIFASVALLLASVGLYAVVAHSVSQRSQEIGVRIAVGATSRDILRLVFKQGMLPLGIGLTIGLAVSLAVNRILEAELVRVSPADPTTYVVTSLLLILSALFGCWIPARRAMRIDPLVSLRQE